MLIPVSNEVFFLALENWAIWKRWERASIAEGVNRGSHAALPPERDRHLHIQSILDEQLKTDKERCIIRAGAFANAGTEVPAKGILVELVVKWSEPSGDSDCIWAD